MGGPTTSSGGNLSPSVRVALSSWRTRGESAWVSEVFWDDGHAEEEDAAVDVDAFRRVLNKKGKKEKALRRGRSGGDD